MIKLYTVHLAPALGMGADWCSTLGNEQMICVLAWGARPLCWVAPPTWEVRGYNYWENLVILHENICIFVHFA